MHRFDSHTVRPVSDRPIAPSRRRLDIDSFVGFAFLALLPIALWFA